jgi:two-component system, cell cycle sensor histidine kinase and response regulator CckA
MRYLLRTSRRRVPFAYMNRILSALTNDSNLGARLILSFVLLITIVGCLGFVGLKHLRADVELEEIIDARLSKVQLSRSALTLSNLNNRITMQVFLIEDENEINSLLTNRAKNSGEISTLVATLRSKVESREEAQLLDAIEKNRTPYLESYQRALHLLVVDKKPVEARAVMVEEALPRLLKYHGAWNAYVDYQGNQLNQAQSTTSASYFESRIEAFLLISLAIALAIAIGFLVTRNLTRHMAKRKLAEEGLQQAHDELEMRVRERTSQLAATNDELQDEIAARKLIEDELRKSEERYRLLFDSNPSPLWVYDLESLGFLAVNSAAVQSYGYSREEFLAMTITDIRPPEDALALVDTVTRLNDGSDNTGKWRHRKKDGSIIDVEIASHALKFAGRPARIVLAIDITERKSAEEKLKESRQWITTIYDSSRDGIIVEESEHIVYVNQSYAHLFGYEPGELVGRPVSLVSEQGPGERMLEYSRRRMRGEEAPSLYEFRGTRKDGTTVDLEASVSTAKIANKTHIVSLVRDITERKRAESEILLQKARFQQLFENAPLGILRVDQNNIVIDANKEFENIFQFSLDEMRGRNINEVVVPEAQVEEGTALSSQTLRGEIVEKETVRKRKDGTVFPVQIYGVPILADQKLAGIFAIYIDLSERKRMEDERQIISEIIQGAITTPDLDDFLKLAHHSIGKYLYAENCFIALYDEATELMHFPFWVDKLDPCPPPRPVGIGFSSYVLRTGKPILVDAELTEQMYQRGEIVKSGSTSASWLGVPLRTPTRTIGVLAVQHYEEENAYDERDQEFLTAVGNQIALAIERKRAEMSLRETENQLRQSQKMESIGTLAGGIAHDFNNLMTAVTGYSELALRHLEAGDPLRTKIEEIKKAGERAAALTSQLLAFSRKQILQPKVLDLNTVVTGIGKMLPRMIGEDIELLIELSGSLGHVKADRGQIEQVLMNLATNARDAMPGGGYLTIKTENVCFNAKVSQRHAVVEPGRYVMLSVSDNGSGMDAETQTHIFEPFFTTKEIGKGTGLGLSTAYGIVKQSGGSIWVYSEVGRGTSFKIYLPRVDAVFEHEESDKSRPVPRGSETILLVEDEDVVRDLSREILEEYGYAVLTAPDGKEGLRICKEFKGQIDLMITDVVMPQMNGRELAEKLGVLRPDARVLYMSGFTDDAIVRHGVLDDGTCFIQKPFSPDALALKTREILDQNGSH